MHTEKYYLNIMIELYVLIWKVVHGKWKKQVLELYV